MKKHEILNNLIKIAGRNIDKDFRTEVINFIYEETERLEKENKELKKEIKEKEFEIEIQDFILDMQHGLIMTLLEEGEK